MAACASVVGSDALASGSVGPGGVKAAARADYARGKALLFRNLVCRACPIQRRGFNRTRARALMAELGAALNQQGGEDSSVRVLCGGEGAGCAAKVETVRYYLNRRYRLGRGG